MVIEIKIPSPGESITEVELATWFVSDGDVVQKDQEIGEVESEKATLPLIADKAGKVELLAEEGATVEVGTVVCKIDTSVAAEASTEDEDNDSAEQAEKESNAEGDKGSTTEGDKNASAKTPEIEKDKKVGDNKTQTASESKEVERSAASENIKVTPVAKKMMEEEGFSVDDIVNGLRKITSSDVEAVKSAGISSSESVAREEERNTMSQLRKKISERLVAVKNETAMLTTFNEADMSGIMDMRKRYQKYFTDKHGVKLGFMSFFTKAVSIALKAYPAVNSYIDGEEIVTPNFADVGIAVQTDKGLMVPVLRDVDAMSLADIERTILDIAGRARKNRISMDELTGGTFTITNGGIFGSMLSTPILNPPQSAILGMHNIIDRPVAVNGKVEIRPMMYLALSYDHRVIDGRDSVGFLKTVKEFIEDPTSMLLGSGDPNKLLLDL